MKMEHLSRKKNQTWTAVSENSARNDVTDSKTPATFAGHQDSSWVKTMLRDNKTLGYLVQRSRKLHNKKAPVLILTDGSNQLNR